MRRTSVTLRINEAEAETVRTLYALYRKHGTLRQVKAEADRLRLRTKQRFAADVTRTGGLPFRRGHLHCLLDQSSLRRPHPAPEACLRGPASIDHCSGDSGTRSKRSCRQGLPNQGDARRRAVQPVPHWQASSSTRPGTG